MRADSHFFLTETRNKARLTALYAICLQIFCGISEQSAKKSDDASYAQALFGVPLEPVLHLYKHRCKTGSFYFVRYCLWKMQGGDAHIAPINPELCRQLRLSLSNCLSHKNYFQIPV